MAELEYKDPYQGWYAMPRSNVTAHEILTDTSGRWEVALLSPTLRIYRMKW